VRRARERLYGSPVDGEEELRAEDMADSSE